MGVKSTTAGKILRESCVLDEPNSRSSTLAPVHLRMLTYLIGYTVEGAVTTKREYFVQGREESGV